MGKKHTGFVPRSQASSQPLQNVLQYAEINLIALIDELRASGMSYVLLDPLIRMTGMTAVDRAANAFSSTLLAMARGGDRFPKNGLPDSEYRLLCALQDFNVSSTTREKVFLALLIQDRSELFNLARPTFAALLGE